MDPQHATPAGPEHRDIDSVFAAISAVSGAVTVPLSMRDAMARAAVAAMDEEHARMRAEVAYYTDADGDRWEPASDLLRNTSTGAVRTRDEVADFFGPLTSAEETR